ncbi:protein SIEVE ELEMENT OCCLUSION B-like [Senna tora]|uniref:Protein SIEVE ELEMENT OCCLUSION B-like n=1 Tax=Senna tora TaxID=362788 RepID=A0A835CFR2_9FABA|nr:protein SIEVE ELEMENT OCCLUSION B-like [Senna tora]
MQSRTKSGLPLLASESDENAVTTQIVAIHSPADASFDVRSLLKVVQHIFHPLTDASLIPPILQGKPPQLDALDDYALQSDIPHIHMLHDLSPTISKISTELSCKCSDGEEAHATTMAILGMLSCNSWDSKVAIALAAFALNFGGFCLLTHLHATNNPLAKSIAMLKKHIIIIDDDINMGRHKHEGISNIINTMLDVTDLIVDFQNLLPYDDDQTLLHYTTRVPIAVYWIIRSIVTCASQLSSFMTSNSHLYKHVAASSKLAETWELSSLVHKLNNLQSHLQKQLALCHKHIDDSKQTEAFQALVHLFETSHFDNLKILKALINNKNNPLPLLDGSTKKRVSIDVLGNKIVLLFISHLDLSDQELLILGEMYQESRHESDMFEIPFEVVWLPVVNKTTAPRTEVKQKKLEELQSKMSWHSVCDPWMLEEAVIRYMKEVWHFKKKPILVVLDQHGNVGNLNALHIMWIWGSLAYPFTIAVEEDIWKEQVWGLELLADIFHPLLLTWISEGKYICLYGGEDLEWIRKFTKATHAMANTLHIPLEMIYMGKSNPREKIERNKEAIVSENLSHTLEDVTLIWYFWVRVESMWHSKLQLGHTIESDPMMQEIMTILSFDQCNEGWALIGGGTKEKNKMMVKVKGETFLKCVNECEEWKEKVKEKGVLGAMDDCIKGLQIQIPHHCNHLIVPESNGETTPEKVVCSECGRLMDKFFMYRCTNN